MIEHVTNREFVIEAVRQELVGPSPQGKPIDCNGEVAFNEARHSYGPWTQEDSGEEILQRDPPTKRYGVAVLYPSSTGYDSVSEEEFSNDDLDDSRDSRDAYSEIADSSSRSTEDSGLDSWQDEIESETDDFDLSTSNSYKPSSMAVSFLADLRDGAEVIVEASGGRYQKKTVLVEGQERIWWLRKPVMMNARFIASDFALPTAAKVPAKSMESNNCKGLNLRIEVYSRPHKTGTARLLTVCLINREKASGSVNEKCLFQSHFKVTVISPDGAGNILPYPSVTAERTDPEEQSLGTL